MNTADIEVFKTNVKCPEDADRLKCILAGKYPGSKVSFDLEDCDKVLRIEGNNIHADAVIMLLQNEGIYCRALE